MSDDEEATRPGWATGTAKASCLISKHFASLKNNLASFKEEIKRDQEEAAERIVKKAKREQDYELVKKGNKHKFDFNEKVAGVLEQGFIQGVGTWENLPKPEFPHPKILTCCHDLVMYNIILSELNRLVFSSIHLMQNERISTTLSVSDSTTG